MARPQGERAGLDVPARSAAAGLDVFVSHVEQDHAVALELADALEAHGYSTWTFERDTVPGPSYLLQTSRAIEAARAVVVLISADSLGSHQVTSEVVHAHEEIKPFVPLLVGISREEFAARQPEWREAFGSAATLELPGAGVAAVAPRIVEGLAALGITAHPGQGHQTLSYAAQPSGAGMAPGRRHLLVGLLVAVLVLGAVGVAVALLGNRGEPSTQTTRPTPSATSPAGTPTGPATSTEPSPGTSPGGAPRDAATTPVTTINGRARVKSARVVAKYCSGTGDCKTAPAGRRYLLLDLTAWGSAGLTFDQAVSMSAFGSYVAYVGERATPVETMILDGSPAGFTVVYSNLPAAAAGADVNLFWPDNRPLRVRTEG